MWARIGGDTGWERGEAAGAGDKAAGRPPGRRGAGAQGPHSRRGPGEQGVRARRHILRLFFLGLILADRYLRGTHPRR